MVTVVILLDFNMKGKDKESNLNFPNHRATASFILSSLSSSVDSDRWDAVVSKDSFHLKV